MARCRLSHVSHFETGRWHSPCSLQGPPAASGGGVAFLSFSTPPIQFQKVWVPTENVQKWTNLKIRFNQ